MKRRTLALLVPLASLLLLPGPAPAQLVNGRFTTSVYSFNRFDTIGTSHAYLRAFQSVQLSVAQGNLSLNTYFQGAVNGANEFGENGHVRFYNLYLRWADIGRVLDLNLGRQAIYAGVGNGTIDGLSARARVMGGAITVSGFAGPTVADDYTGVRKNWHDNFSLGGQVVTTLLPDARIGLSYMSRREERDPYIALREIGLGDSLRTYVVTPLLIEGLSDAVQLGGVDASWSYGRTVAVYGRYDYDFNYARTSRGLGSVRVNVTDRVALTGDFSYRKPQIAFNSIFSVFTLNSTSQITGGVEYALTPLVRAFGRLGTISYADTSGMTWSLGVNSGYGSASYSGSTGYAGQLSSISVQGAYPLFERLLVPSLGISWSSYRLSADDPRRTVLAVLVGASVRPTRNLSFDVQGQWENNRIYARDERIQVRVLYWFAERLSLFSQEVH